jgi:hypothetical protein
MKVCFHVEFAAILHLTRRAVYDVHANKKGLYFACFCEWPTPVPFSNIPFLFSSENNIGKSGTYQRECQGAI